MTPETTTGSAMATRPEPDPARNRLPEGGRLRVAPGQHPGRQRPKPLGDIINRPGELVGLRVADARHHVHVQGETGTGKSTWLANHVLAEAAAGRGVALLDCQGDLARHVLDRLPARCGDRLIILDPAEHDAPPAWNVLAPAHPTDPADTAADGGGGLAGREWAAENVVGVLRRLYASSWGPRMTDTLRAACLTLARRPGSTLADVVPILTRPQFRAGLIAHYGEPDGYGGFWDGFDALTPAAQAQMCGPILSRLRGVLSRRFARDLLGTPCSTVNLSDVLDGGILIARLPKGELGEDTARVVGSLLLAGLWSHTTRRSALKPEQRRDATIVVDECHNFLNLPIGIEDALAEARGYGVSLVLAHQHLAQLPTETRAAVAANARTKLLFTVSPEDAAKLARHVGPFFDEHDLARRPAFEAIARPVHHGHDQPAFTVATRPLPPAVAGRAEALRATARARVGLSHHQRYEAAQRQQVASTHLGDSPRRSVSPSLSRSVSPSLSRLDSDGDRDTPPQAFPQLSPDEEDSR